VKGSAQRKRGRFEKGRESVTVGWSLVCKHISEKKNLVFVYMIGTDEGVVEESRHPLIT